MRAVRALIEKYALRFEEEFHDAVKYTVVIRSDQVEEFSAQLTEISQGRAGMVKLDHIEVP
jgi:putative IMPACT (imprinted ancient) family translation regulator